MTAITETEGLIGLELVLQADPGFKGAATGKCKMLVSKARVDHYLV